MKFLISDSKLAIVIPIKITFLLVRESSEKDILISIPFIDKYTMFKDDKTILKTNFS